MGSFTMRRHVYWAALVVAAALIEASWLGVIRLQGVMPDLILLLLIYFGVTKGDERAMFTGLIGGLVQDVTGDTLLGHHVLPLVAVGFIVGRLSERLVTGHPSVKVALVFCASLFHGLLFISISYFQNPELNALYLFGVSVIPRAFYTALMTPLIFFALERSRHFGADSTGDA
ncbi:MAG: rod shape-determining protein MreD, partial [Candidatus Hydrogenedentes bacterium]|nr:rod shape-determining protein MreD [Candidatus Hydrogenedentota bacterium]